MDERKEYIIRYLFTLDWRIETNQLDKDSQIVKQTLQDVQQYLDTLCSTDNVISLVA